MRDIAFANVSQNLLAPHSVLAQSEASLEYKYE